MSDSIVQAPLEADLLIRNIGQLVTMAQHPIEGATGALSIIERAAVASNKGTICWIGRDEEVSSLFPAKTGKLRDEIDAEGSVVTPGFVDSHTHLVFAGHRAAEFHLRRSGITYGELLAQGKGILTTVQATRNASTAELRAMALPRLESLRRYGTTTVEVKTGYGLSVEAEERCLQIINELMQLEELRKGPHIVPTFLGAHTLPPEYRNRRGEYVDLIVTEMLPRFAGLATFCDVFCEREAFTLDESRRILERAKGLGYKLKLHADQLSAGGGARVAAELGAVSADHLDHASNDDLDAMREAGVVATLLPGCSFTLRSPYPSARKFLDRGLTVALATDFNPGTSYCENMQMMIELAMSAMGMTLEEALTAATINGARALALEDRVGSIELGKHADLLVWSISDYHEIGYHFGVNHVRFALVQR